MKLKELGDVSFSELDLDWDIMTCNSSKISQVPVS
jgi:hypothetical protein